MAISTEKIKTVIICRERGFKNLSVGILTDIAFPGEKLVSETGDGAVVMLNNEKWAQNVVINGVDFPEDEVKKICETVSPAIKNHAPTKKIKTLVYLAEDVSKNAINDYKAKFPLLEFRASPPKKKDFTDVFNPIVIKSATTAPPPKPKPAAPAKKPKSGEVAGFFEASKHVKDTIERLNHITKDRSNLKALEDIGQRFNGFIGTFAFAGDRDGFKHLKKLAIIIDDTCRFYQKDSCTR